MTLAPLAEFEVFAIAFRVLQTVTAEISYESRITWPRLFTRFYMAGVRRKSENVRNLLLSMSALRSQESDSEYSTANYSVATVSFFKLKQAGVASLSTAA